MHFDSDPTAAAFRDEIRSFVARHFPVDANGRLATQTQITQWTRALRERSWLAPHWPAEWEGSSLSALHRYILNEELCAPQCPPTDRIAIDMVGPVISTFGSDQQKQHYLPRILAAQDIWCQGFSEPQAGSDVSAVRTRATRDRDSYLVSGQKLWTSRAHVATMMFALVRVAVGGVTQNGLSFLLIDMRSPGIEVRPVPTIDGLRRVNEVFLNDVRVPAENLIGSEGKGWMYARSLLTNERALISGIPQTARRLEELKNLATDEAYLGRPLSRNPQFRQRYAELSCRLLALKFLLMRVWSSDVDAQTEGLTAVLKLRGAALSQDVNELLFESLGERSLSYCADGIETATVDAHAHACAIDFLYGRSASIAGGTSEIQRNIIAAGVLGL